MSTPSASQLQITIKGANKREGDSLYNSGYVDYTISTVCNHPAFPAGYFTVDRRYSDFVWLREELGKTYPAIIIPSLPEKQVIGRFENNFIEARKRGMQKFLNKVAGNLTLVESARFVKFLTAGDKAFGLERLSTEQRQQEEMKDSFTSWWDTSFQTVMDSVASITSSTSTGGDTANVEQLECEGEVSNVSEYIDRLDGYTTKLINTTLAKINMDTETANVSNAFGNSFLALSGKEHGLAAANFGQIGQRSVTVHDNGKSLVLSEEELFLEPIREFHRYILSTKETIGRREDRKKAYIKAVKNCNALAVKADRTQQEVEEAAALVKSTKKEFEEVSEIFLQEFSRFKYETSADMVDAMFHFTRLQADYHKRASTLWDEYEEYQFVAVPVTQGEGCIIN